MPARRGGLRRRRPAGSLVLVHAPQPAPRPRPRPDRRAFRGASPVARGLARARSSSPDWLFGPDLDKTLAALGPRAPDLLFPSGGEASYWHDRRDGPWGRYVVEEAIPAAVDRLGADPRRIAIDGFSMGGFGALDIARLHPGRFCAAGGHAAALWRTGGETPAGAFDDAEDFARHDVIDAARRGWPFGRTRIWIDVGRDGPFRDADTALAAALGRRAHFTVWPGKHEGAYVRRHLPRTLGFYAAALAHCGS